MDQDNQVSFHNNAAVKIFKDMIVISKEEEKKIKLSSLKNSLNSEMCDKFARKGKKYIRLSDGVEFSDTLRNTTLGNPQVREWLKNFGHELPEYVEPEKYINESIPYDDSINPSINYFKNLLGDKLLPAFCAAFIYARKSNAEKTRFNLNLIGEKKSGKSTIADYIRKMCKVRDTSWESIKRDSLKLDNVACVYLDEQIVGDTKHVSIENQKRYLGHTHLEGTAVYEGIKETINKGVYIFTSNKQYFGLDPALQDRVINVKVDKEKMHQNVQYEQIKDILINEDKKHFQMLLRWMEEQANLFSDMDDEKQIIMKLNNFADEYYNLIEYKEVKYKDRKDIVLDMIEDGEIEIGQNYAKYAIRLRCEEMGIACPSKGAIITNAELYDTGIYIAEEKPMKINGKTVAGIVFQKRQIPA